MPTTLNKALLLEAAHALASSDEDFARVLATHGPPPLWARRPGFVTLLRIILEQQVYLTSADAMYRRLVASTQSITPANILAGGTGALREIGITRQKASCFINVSQAIKNRSLVLSQLGKAEDEAVIAKLTKIKGIGPWTARIYLLMALRRGDVWPEGDIALATAAKNLKNLQQRPSQPELTGLAKNWRPHRATAARMLWHYYLNGMSLNDMP